jgi:hypothetical protein
MQIDRRELQGHYAALSDEELLALDRAELTGVAQTFYDAEFTKRHLARVETGSSGDSNGSDPPSSALSADDDRAEPDWLEDATCAVAYGVLPNGSAASDAESVRKVLLAAGIPCRVSLKVLNPDKPDMRYYCVMIPGAHNLEAASVLNLEINNPQEESLWRAHFASLSNEELRGLKFEVICAGLQDRLARLKRAYGDEIAQRGLR